MLPHFGGVNVGCKSLFSRFSILLKQSYKYVTFETAFLGIAILVTHKQKPFSKFSTI